MGNDKAYNKPVYNELIRVSNLYYSNCSLSDLLSRRCLGIYVHSDRRRLSSGSRQTGLFESQEHLRRV